MVLQTVAAGVPKIVELRRSWFASLDPVGYAVKHQESKKSRHFFFTLGLSAACLAATVGCSGTIRGSGSDISTGDGGNNSNGGSAGNRSGGTVGSLGSSGSRLLPGGGLRRLPVRELEATLDTVFPELKTTRPHFPPDGYAVFDNEQKNLDNGLAFLENAALAMSTLVEQSRANPKIWARVRTCPGNGTPSVCMERFYKEWAPRILRRPGNDIESKAYIAIANQATDLGGIDDVLAVGLEAMLRQPDFFHRVELGEGKDNVRTLTQSELLGRLSFFLWGEAPDDALRTKADGEDLTNASTREAFAKVMLEDPRAERQTVDYHAQWLGFSTMPRDGIKLDMWNESAALVRRVVFEKDFPYEQLEASFCADQPELPLHSPSLKYSSPSAPRRNHPRPLAFSSVTAARRWAGTETTQTPDSAQRPPAN